MRRWVCFDVGEVLVDETRVWSTWADHLRVPRLTLMAAIGGVIARGGDYAEAFDLLGLHGWHAQEAAVQAAFGGFRADDLYPDALPALAALAAAGYGVAVIGNQPACRTAELRALGVTAPVVAMSDDLGAAKPDPRFFALALAAMGDPDPAQVAYVGDRVDNDVLPSAAAGLVPVRLRRGPWGLLQEDAARVAALEVRSLAELVAQVDALWPGSAQDPRPAR